jgi:hypothetical protein
MTYLAVLAALLSGDAGAGTVLRGRRVEAPSGGVDTTLDLWWEFTTTNSGTIVDSSYQTNTGALPGGSSDPALENVTGANYALHFDGSDDYVSRGNKYLGGISTQQSGTVSMWNYVDTDGGGVLCPLSVSGLNGDVNNFFLVYTDLRYDYWQMRFRAKRASDSWNVITASNSTDWTIGKWVHIVLTQNGTATNTQFYVNATNNVLTVSEVVDQLDWFGDMGGPTNVVVGRLYYGGAYYFGFDGLVDEVKFYNYAMTAAQVTNLFETEKVKFTGY